LPNEAFASAKGSAPASRKECAGSQIHRAPSSCRSPVSRRGSAAPGPGSGLARARHPSSARRASEVQDFGFSSSDFFTNTRQMFSSAWSELACALRPPAQISQRHRLQRQQAQSLPMHVIVLACAFCVVQVVILGLVSGAFKASPDIECVVTEPLVRTVEVAFTRIGTFVVMFTLGALLAIEHPAKPHLSSCI
jgi:hypothetical protein